MLVADIGSECTWIDGLASTVIVRKLLDMVPKHQLYHLESDESINEIQVLE